MRFEPPAALGAAFVLGSLFLPWYRAAETPDEFPGGRDALPLDAVSATAWQAFTVLDVALAALAVLSVRSRAAAAVAAALIVLRAVDSPGPDAVLDLGPGPWLALVGALIALLASAVRPWMGSALLIASLFAPWYWYAVYVITRGAAGTRTVSMLDAHAREFTAWQVFTVLDVLLVVLALAAARSWAAAALAAALVAYRLIDTPTPIGDLRLGAGAWLALAGALIALVARLRPRDTASP